MLRHLLIPLIVGVVLVVPGVALATDYYVSNACQYDGDGLAPTCAAAGQSGARNNLQTFLDATTLHADDTVFIRAGNGTYVTRNTAGADYAHDVPYTGNYRAEGFRIYGSGTAGHPITIRNYPGETPLLANCADNENTEYLCHNATMSLYQLSYVRVTGLKIRGLLIADSTGAGAAQGIVVDHNEFYQGYASGPGVCPSCTGNNVYSTSGNWSALRLEQMTGAWVHHNYFHDMSPALPGYSTVDSQTYGGTCAKLYTAIYSVLEWNTFENCSTAMNGGVGAAIHDKQDAYHNTYRYNHFISNSAAVWFQAQRSDYPSIDGVSMHHNLIEPGIYAGMETLCLEVSPYSLTGYAAYNNTCIAKRGVNQSGGGPLVGTMTTALYNNIYYVSTENEHYYGASLFPALDDYNVYTDGGEWYFSDWNLDAYHLGDFQAGATAHGAAYGAHSRSLTYSVSAFGFVSSSDFHLTSNSAARGTGRVSGVSGGAVVDAGVFEGAIQCVGHLCPMPPDGVRVTK